MADLTHKKHTRLELLQGLRDILKTKAGIYPITQQQLDDSKIEALLVGESSRSMTSFNIDLIKIDDLKSSINQFLAKQTFSHLGIFYGLEAIDTEHQIHLIIKGVNLDDSEMANLKKKPHYTSFDFSNFNIMSTGSDTQKSLKSHFRNTFRPLFNNKKIVYGAYISVGDFLDALKVFENEGCDVLKTTFGFMKAINFKDWNCFHLIFRGVNSSTNTQSTSIFCTHDGEKGYSGIKPSTPPFSE